MPRKSLKKKCQLQQQVAFFIPLLLLHESSARVVKCIFFRQQWLLRPCTFLLDVIKDIPMQTSNVEVNDLSGPRTIVVLHDENACGMAAATRDIS